LASGNAVAMAMAMTMGSKKERKATKNMKREVLQLPGTAT
jgi:hypothetical protein